MKKWWSIPLISWWFLP